MSFGRHKRLLLGGLAALAPVPLPLNEIIGWPSLMLFWLAVGLFLWRTWKAELTPLPTWAMNLAGLAYLPVLFLDFVVFWEGRLLQPLVHLALFALAMKLFGMKLEKDKWHILLLSFFTFVAAMGSSVHPSVLLYLAAFLAGSMLVLARFASFHLLSSYGAGGALSSPTPLRGFIVTGTLLTLIGAIPLFAFLPRLGTPYLVGPGGGSSLMTGGAGLMEQITLDVIGRIRTSRAVAMRVSYENPHSTDHEMRFRAGVYSEFRNNAWARGQRRTRALRRAADGFFHVAQELPKTWLGIWLEPGVSSGLVMPIEAVRVDVVTPALHIDEVGLVTLPFGRFRTLTYRVGMIREARLVLEDGWESEPTLRGVDRLSGVTDEIARLAREVAGEGPAAIQAERIEAHLIRNYEYTLDLVGTESDNPVEDFLLRWRRGHCEYFASSMVLMLRSLGIPARFVTGYLGGEYSPFEGYYVVRQSDAHAWVEAHLPDSGWKTFDPTPPAGRPSTRSAGWNQLLSQAYDYLIFRWDRYVLTYGFFDQVGIARRFLTWWAEWRRSRAKGPRPVADPGAAADDPQDSEISTPESDFDLTVLEVTPFALLLIFAAWWIWRHRPAFSAIRAYRQLRSRVEQDHQMSVPGSLPPLRLAEHIAEVRPPASAPARRVINLYLRESFGGQELSEDERQELRVALRSAMQNLRKSA